MVTDHPFLFSPMSIAAYLCVYSTVAAIFRSYLCDDLEEHYPDTLERETRVNAVCAFWPITLPIWYIVVVLFTDYSQEGIEE